ncbi:MAG: hypothetical protein EPO23_04460 [Xanthobacteraceae bacterium]|nr:MAG: hypothetical protein EPO23_04460 [Xanthobacteraceae bacterium]
MRRMILAAAAAVVVLGAGSLMASRAEAMTLPGIAPVAGAVSENGMVQDVRLVCRRVWNGYRWVRQCWRAGPPGPWRPRPYRYY